jgi:Family of unknown function (DUF5752)
MESFVLTDCALISIATGEMAHNLRELRDRLVRLEDPAITYFHFWGGLLRPHFVDPEYQNDFAAWAYHDLHERRLAERLAIINPNEFDALDDLRRHVIDVVEERMDEQDAAPYSEAETPFFFMRFQIVIFDTRQRIHSPEQLAEILPRISLGSLFYHFIDSRRRTQSKRNDFSEWMGGWGKQYASLAAKIAAVDPYFNSLSELRDHLRDIMRANLQGASGP